MAGGGAHTGWLLFGLAPGPCHAAQRSSPGPQGSSLSTGRPQGWGEPAPSRKGPGLQLMGTTAHQGLLCCPYAHVDYLGEGLLPSHCQTPAPLCIPLVTTVTATHPSSGCTSHRRSHVSALFRMPSSHIAHKQGFAGHSPAVFTTQPPGEAPLGSSLYGTPCRPTGWPQALAPHRPAAARIGALLETNLCPLPASPQLWHPCPPAAHRGPSTTPGQQSREVPRELGDAARHSQHGKALAPPPITFGQQAW